MRQFLAGVLLIAACAARPRAGDRTILIDIPIGGLTNSGHRTGADCGACLRDQRPGEQLVSCARIGGDVRAHWDTMMCAYETP